MSHKNLNPETPAPAFEVSNLSYQVGQAKILRNVSLDIHYGKVLALVGPNGAGKSTLLSALTGDIKPTAGQVKLRGQTLRQWDQGELARQRSVLLQENMVAFSFTSYDVVEMGRAPWRRSSTEEEDAAAISDAMQRADVVHLQDRSFPSLSGGEKARVSLARVLAQNTAIVLLDEPTAALDLKHQESVLQEARHLANQGTAVVVVLHDLSLAAAYADDMAMLSYGELASYGTPHEVLTQETVEQIYQAPVRVIRDPDTGRPVILPRRTLN